MVTDRVGSNKYDRLLVLLVLSLFFGGIGGSLQAPRILAVLFLPFLVGKVRKCKCIKSILVFFVFFIFYCLFSLLWTPDRTEGLKEIVYYIVHFILFTEIIVFSFYARDPLKSLSKGWAFVVFFLSLIVAWELATGNHLSMAREEDLSMNIGGVISDRLTVSATYGNYNGYVSFLCFASPWIIYFFLVSESLFYRGISLFSLLGSFVAILINGSRGGYFCLGIFAVVYFLFIPKNKKNVLRSLILVAILGVILFKYSEELLLVITLKSEATGMTTDKPRMDIWSASFNILLQTGGVGVGVGGMIPSLKAYSSSIIPNTHNIFLEALLQYGVIPSLFFFGFLIKLFKRGLKVLDKNRRMSVIMSLAALPVYGIINSNYLLGPDLYVLLGTIFVFVYYERIKAIHPILRSASF